jgi:hypothetical protein
MIDPTYEVTGVTLIIWYIGLRWIYCSKETWLYNPINFLTAITSILFLIPTLFILNSTMNKVFYCLSIWVLFRNFTYAIEDIIDLKNNHTPRQSIYVALDLVMIAYVILWQVKYYRGQ